MKKRYTMIVKDQAGVLNRITGYIRRNGWDLRSVFAQPIGDDGKSELIMEIDLNKMAAQKFEQRLHDWNFVFSLKEGE